MNIKLTEFQKWLEGFSDLDIVGEARECEKCPLAKFVIETMPFRQVQVFVDKLRVEDHEGEYKYFVMEPWEQKFVEYTDDLYSAGEGVPALKAREVLQRAKTETEEPPEYL